MYLSIVIPAYNEESRIVRTIENTLAYLNKQSYQSEILVISDGSTDRTKHIVENGFKPGRKVAIKAYEYHPNRGKGYAVRFGMLKSSGEHIMFMDADYSVPVEEIEKGLKLLRHGADIAIGSRTIYGAVVLVHQNFFRQLSAKIYTFIQNCYLGIPYKDTQCGFKVFKSQAAKKLFQEQRLDSVIFDQEILWLAKKYGLKVMEFPVRWRHVEGSRIVYDSLKKSLFVFQELFRIKKVHR
ncbi:MAG: glycosyltransferase family 2 protein [Deltaproteobacteria bacterium]|nr:glycosyltransferase family 2 protein [Deltaproteobacteria bacterium]